MGISNTRYIQRFSLPAAFLLFLAILSSCASPGITVFELAPVSGKVSTASLQDGQLVFAARYLDPDQRMTYLREKGYEALGLGLRQIPFVAFSLRVENGSDQELILDPGSIRLAVGYGPLLSPYNYAHLYMELPQGSDRQQILVDLRKAVFEKSTTIAPGEGIEKLLLFKRPERVGPKVAILFERLYVGGIELQAVLDFVAVDLEK